MKTFVFSPVIPAEAGTHFDLSRVIGMHGNINMGPRFRGDDDLMRFESALR
jgi:hypothetical protein